MSAVLPSASGTSAAPAAPLAPIASFSKMSAPLASPFPSEERLNLSRERMRLWLETARGGKQSQRLSDRARRSGWLSSLRTHPAAEAAIGALSVWWSRHPFRAVVALADGLLRTSSIGSRARQRPVAVITLGVLAGAVAVWARPWRWILRPAVFVGLMTQVANRVISDMPLESMIKVFTAFAGGSKNRTAATSTEPNRSAT